MLIGGSLFMAVRRPEKPMDQGNLEHNVHVFTTFQTQLDGAVKASIQLLCTLIISVARWKNLIPSFPWIDPPPPPPNLAQSKERKGSTFAA